MFAKFSLILLLASITLGYAFSHHDDSAEEHHHNLEKHNHTKGHKHDHKHEHKHDHQEHEQEHHQDDPKLEREGLYGGMNLKINFDAPFLKIKNLTEDFYSEIFVIASGENDLSPEVPNDVYVNARVAVLSSQKLHCMTKVYQIFANLAVEYAQKGVKPYDTQTIVYLINDLAAQVKNSCPHSEHIKSSLTDSFISHGKFFKAGMVSKEKEEAYDKWLREPFMKTASLNRLFYRGMMKGDDKHYYKILRSIVDHAINNEHYQEKLEKIYANAVARTIVKTCPSHERQKAIMFLYQYLMEQLADDAALSVMLYGDHKLVMINKPF